MTIDKDKDEAQLALDEARRLTDRGDYEAALQKHIWFHDNALSIRPSFYGVRLSFALGDWMRLGQKFPKALQELRKIRDAKVARLSSGELDRHLFHDIVAINNNLDENYSTVELFKELDRRYSDFALKIFAAASHPLVKGREYVLARKYLHDPRKLFLMAKARYEEGVRMADQKDDESAEAARRAFRDIFAKDVTDILTILTQTGDEAVAMDIHAEAAKVVDHPSLEKFFET